MRIVLLNDTAGAQTAAHQKRMMGEVAKLLGADPERRAFSISPRLSARWTS